MGDTITIFLAMVANPTDKAMGLVHAGSKSDFSKVKALIDEMKNLAAKTGSDLQDVMAELYSRYDAAHGDQAKVIADAISVAYISSCIQTARQQKNPPASIEIPAAYDDLKEAALTYAKSIAMTPFDKALNEVVRSDHRWGLTQGNAAVKKAVKELVDKFASDKTVPMDERVYALQNAKHNYGFWGTLLNGPNAKVHDLLVDVAIATIEKEAGYIEEAQNRAQNKKKNVITAKNAPITKFDVGVDPVGTAYYELFGEYNAKRVITDGNVIGLDKHQAKIDAILDPIAAQFTAGTTEERNAIYAKLYKQFSEAPRTKEDGTDLILPGLEYGDAIAILRRAEAMQQVQTDFKNGKRVDLTLPAYTDFKTWNAAWLEAFNHAKACFTHSVGIAHSADAKEENALNLHTSHHGQGHKPASNEESKNIAAHIDAASKQHLAKIRQEMKHQLSTDAVHVSTSDIALQQVPSQPFGAGTFRT